MDAFKMHLNLIRSGINNSLASKEPLQIVTLTTTTVLLSVWLYQFTFKGNESICNRAKKSFFKLIRLIPAVRQKIDDELRQISETFQKEASERTKGLRYVTVLPPRGLSNDKILELVDENLNLGGINWKEGVVSGTVYYFNPNLMSLLNQVYGKASYTNPLHPDIFPGLCKMEAEVIRMAANLFHGDEKVCGTMTTGGTESILMACKAFRDYGRDVKGIEKPEIVIPITAHSAFDKSAQYLGLRVRYVPIDPVTTQADLKAMRRTINRNTVMLVGSAPNFPYGTMDDIEGISDLGLRYGIPVHVDSCLGGFLTAFMADVGYPIPPCDFRLPGVTSISADTHKYGFAPKGSSVILYRDTKYRHYQFTVTTDWPGGVYGSPTVGGSRAGGNIAVCWASLLHFGREGYELATKDIIHTTKYIEKNLRKIKGIFVFGQPVTSVVAIGSADFDIYRLSQALSDLGWHLNILQFPSGIHICVTSLHTKPGVADKFLNDTRKCVQELMLDPGVPVEGKMALYCVAQNLPDRSIVRDFVCYFLDSTYYTPSGNLTIDN